MLSDFTTGIIRKTRQDAGKAGSKRTLRPAQRRTTQPDHSKRGRNGSKGLLQRTRYAPYAPRAVTIYRLDALEKVSSASVNRLPFSIKVLLEAALRQAEGFEITSEAVETIANWGPETAGKVEIPFKPARVILQDFTGVPSVVDLAALRSAMARMGGDANKINPVVPVDLVIDHSVQVDRFGSAAALFFNAEREFERNRERYEFLKWGQRAFDNFRVVPPATGIVHQVNLEYLASVVQTSPDDDSAAPPSPTPTPSLARTATPP